MRSPLGARFPPYGHGLPLLIAIALLPACTAPEPRTAPARPEPSATAPITQDATTPDGPSEEADLGNGVRGTEIADRDSRRTVRGSAPGYVEIETAAVEGSVDELRLRLSLTGEVPERMPDGESALRVSFSITTKAGRRYAFDAQCVRAGWGAFASGGPPDAPVPEVVVEGNRVDLVVDPSYLGGLQPFDWLASITWASGTANYAFDAVPKAGLAAYP